MSLRTAIVTFSFSLGLGACGSEGAVYRGFGDVAADGVPGSDAGTDASDGSCVTDTDCTGGATCQSGRCVGAGEVCAPGVGSCEGNVAVTCDESGSGWTRADCGAASCVEGARSASCLSSSCEVGEVGCVDAETAYACVDGGRVVAACETGEGCVGGSCRPRVCTPRARTCDGETVRVCDATGTTESTVRCALVPACQDAPGGCVCDEGDCVPRACTPSERSCDGAEVIVCDATGAGWSAVATCADGALCAGGECRSSTCTPGTAECSGNALVTCGGDGRPAVTDCGLAAARCDATSGACVPRVCTPGVAACASSGRAREVCDETGSASTRVDCASGTYCSGGECVPEACVPGARFCDGGDAYVCNSLGSATLLAEACADGATCAEGRCIGGAGECSGTSDCPPPRGRCEGTTLVSFTGDGACTSGTCTFDDVTRRTDCAASGRVCSSVSLTCAVPDGTTCATDSGCPGGYCVAGRCAACRTGSDCEPGDVCVDGDCVACTCPEGSICDASGICVAVADACTSDAECQAQAEALGASPDGVGCDPVLGCFTRGRCGADDIFASRCFDGQECALRLDLLGYTLISSCKRCTAGDDATCRAGETCTTPLLPLPDATPYCGTDSGFPFPFP